MKKGQDKNHNKKIEFLGVPLYEKTLTSEIHIKSDTERYAYHHPSLIGVSHNPDLNLDVGMRFDPDYWSEMTIETIRAGFFCLYAYKLIDIQVYKYDESYVNKLYTESKKAYSVSANDSVSFKDPILAYIMWAAIVAERDYSARFNILIKLVLDAVLKKGETYDNPWKAFMISLLEKNSTQNIGLRIEKRPSFIPFIKRRWLSLSEDLAAQISIEHKMIWTLIEEACAKHQDFNGFMYRIKAATIKEMKSREHKSSS